MNHFSFKVKLFLTRVTFSIGCSSIFLVAFDVGSSFVRFDRLRNCIDYWRVERVGFKREILYLLFEISKKTSQRACKEGAHDDETLFFPVSWTPPAISVFEKVPKSKRLRKLGHVKRHWRAQMTKA